MAGRKGKKDTGKSSKKSHKSSGRKKGKGSSKKGGSHAKKSRSHHLRPPTHPETLKERFESFGGRIKVKKGVRALVIYSFILLAVYVLYFILGIYKPELLFLGGTFTSYTALLVDVVLIGILIYLIYSLVKRKPWAWWLCILWFSLSILNSVWSVYIMRRNVYNILHELLILSSIFIILINGLIIWYVSARRDYFRKPRSELRFGRKDKVFVYSLVCFWILLILISLSIGYNFYEDTTRIAADVIDEMRGTTPLHAIEICETKTGNERDICFVVFVTVFDEQDLTPVCSRIESDLYRFSCMQVRA
ncbi:MAG: hypothetical protein R6U32_07525 [Candidatus Woesearchaeota archaeon]